MLPTASNMQKDDYVMGIQNENEYDYVLVIRDNPQELNLHNSRISYRYEIIRRLNNASLIINREKHRIGNLYLLKIRSSDDLLEFWAEKMHLLMRLDGSGVYAPFQCSLKSQFEIVSRYSSSSDESIFRSSERQLIIHEILYRKEWDNGVELNSEWPPHRDNDNANESLLNNIVYMYPLHINKRKNELYFLWKYGYNKWEDEHINYKTKIQIIFSFFIKIFNLFWPSQPLNDIVEYFGEEIGFYFAFVEYFIKWLYAPTITGTIIFFIQYLYLDLDNTSDDNNILWFDIQTCDTLLPYYSLFMCIWSTLFIQFWRRKQIELGHKWGVLDIEEKDHKTRLKYKNSQSINNNNNNQMQPNEMMYNLNISHIINNLRARGYKILLTTPIIFLMVMSCIIFMFWFLNMRVALGLNSFISSGLHSLLWGLIVPLLSALHIKICHYLNNWENWRTESDHYKYYTAKVCSLLLINTFVAMYYLCVFEKSLFAVGFQVASFMIARLFLDVAVTIIILPRIRKWKIKRVIKKNLNFKYDPSSIHDNDTGTDGLNIIDMTGDYVQILNNSAWNQALSPKYSSFKNYCFLILIFGYVSNFSIAFCLAPLVALIGIIFKLRSDMFNICCNTQRPLPRRISGIGIWLTVLDQMSVFAICTNILIIYFTTNDFIFSFKSESDNNYNKLKTIIIFEHILLIIRCSLKLIIPEMPLNVKAEIRLHQNTRLVRRKKLLQKINNIKKNKKKIFKKNKLRKNFKKEKMFKKNNSKQPNLRNTKIKIDDLVDAIY